MGGNVQRSAGMNRFKLPLHKRYNLSLVWQDNKARAVAYPAMVCVLVLAGYGMDYAIAKTDLEHTQAAYNSLVADIAKHDAPLGAPGTTWTDWKEGTHRWPK